MEQNGFSFDQDSGIDKHAHHITENQNSKILNESIDSGPKVDDLVAISP